MTHSVPFVCLAGESSLCLGRLPAFEQHRAEASGEAAWGTGRLQPLGKFRVDTVSASTAGRADFGKVHTELAHLAVNDSVPQQSSLQKSFHHCVLLLSTRS